MMLSAPDILLCVQMLHLLAGMLQPHPAERPRVLTAAVCQVPVSESAPPPCVPPWAPDLDSVQSSSMLPPAHFAADGTHQDAGVPFTHEENLFFNRQAAVYSREEHDLNCLAGYFIGVSSWASYLISPCFGFLK